MIKAEFMEMMEWAKEQTMSDLEAIKAVSPADNEVEAESEDDITEWILSMPQ